MPQTKTKKILWKQAVFLSKHGSKLFFMHWVCSESEVLGKIAFKGLLGAEVQPVCPLLLGRYSDAIQIRDHSVSSVFILFEKLN